MGESEGDGKGVKGCVCAGSSGGWTLIPPGPVPEGTALSGVKKEAVTVLVVFAGKEAERGMETPVEPIVPLNVVVTDGGADVAEKLAEVEGSADDVTLLADAVLGIAELGTEEGAEVGNALEDGMLALAAVDAELGSALEMKLPDDRGSEGVTDAANTPGTHVCAAKTSAASAARRLTSIASLQHLQLLVRRSSVPVSLYDDVEVELKVGGRACRGRAMERTRFSL